MQYKKGCNRKALTKKNHCLISVQNSYVIMYTIKIQTCTLYKQMFLKHDAQCRISALENI